MFFIFIEIMFFKIIFFCLMRILMFNFMFKSMLILWIFMFFKDVLWVLTSLVMSFVVSFFSFLCVFLNWSLKVVVVNKMIWFFLMVFILKENIIVLV